MIMASENGSVEANRLSWIDIFEDCGTVLHNILNFMDEFDLYQMEAMYRYDANRKPRPTANSGFSSQWIYLDQLDRSRGENARWRRPHETDEDGSTRDNSDAARVRGIEYIRNSMFARSRAEEARRYFDFNRDGVSADDVPVRSFESMAEKAGDWIHPVLKQNEIPLQRHCMPIDYWQKWTYFDDKAVTSDVRISDVFLELCFHKGEEDSSESRYWRGFRKAHYDWYDKSTRIRLDLDSLVEEMRWTELKNFRDQSRDYSLGHFDVSISQYRMKSLMKKIQVTIHDVADFSSMTTASDRNRRLLIATGGYASPTHSRRDSNMIFAVNANVARFHCRNDSSPLEQVRDEEKMQSDFTPWYRRAQPPCNPSRSTFLQIPTPNNTDQSLEIIIKIQ
mmetsp:Transcript_24968/g.58936  ORF Transcript_24968/g.58936 Transcript_24968/m.58936 type:complete len:393 (-) Transcript_24968:113-1291(-)